MAKETNTQSTTTTKKRSSNWLFNLICYVAVVCIGISLLLSEVGLGGEVSRVLSMIAQAIAYIILIFISCRYLIRRRSLVLWIIWAISVALIVIAFILPLVR